MSPFPSRTEVFVQFPSITPPVSATAASLHDQIFPVVTVTAKADVVRLKLDTEVLIQSFSQFYPDTPISAFRGPDYVRLGDGSLIAPPFIQSSRNAHLTIFYTGAFLMLFTIHAWIALVYLFRARRTVRHIGLFWTLLLSQALGPISFVVFTLGLFLSDLSCRILMIGSLAPAALSHLLLISGILGFKAYRCLNNSRLVLGGLCTFTVAVTALIIMRFLDMNNNRVISGICGQNESPTLSALTFAVLSGEAFFIACCFILAIRQSAAVPDACCCLSIHSATTERGPGPTGIAAPAQLTNDLSRERGWWDYKPDACRSVSIAPPWQGPQTEKGPLDGTVSWIVDGASRPNAPSPVAVAPRIPFTEHHSKQLSKDSRLTSIRIQDSPVAVRRPLAGRRPSSPAPSQFSRISRMFPGISRLRESMRSELYYATLISGSTCVVAVLAAVGISQNFSGSVSFWMAINWAVVSRLILHNTGRVLKRHEQEAALRDPHVRCPSLRPIYTRGREIGRASISPSFGQLSYRGRLLSIPSEDDLEARDDRSPGQNPFVRRGSILSTSSCSSTQSSESQLRLIPSRRDSRISPFEDPPSVREWSPPTSSSLRTTVQPRTEAIDADSLARWPGFGLKTSAVMPDLIPHPHDGEKPMAFAYAV